MARAAATGPGEGRADLQEGTSLREQERIARALLEAFNRREVDLALSLLHPEISLRTVSAVARGELEPYRAHEGIRRYVSDLAAIGLEPIIELAQVRSAGGAVVALGQVALCEPLTGRRVKVVPSSWVLKFRDGLIVEVQVFSDVRVLADLLAAVA